MSKVDDTNDTKRLIIDAAIRVLKTFGMEGLTMRKVALEADMSLGNLQYHYANKAILISALAEHYFGECERLLDEYEHQPNTSRQHQLRSLILYHLDHVEHITDMCRIFREMWALATRDEALHEQLMSYYRVTFNKLTVLIGAMDVTKKQAKQIASFFIPFLEGYSITVHAELQSKAQTVKMLVRICECLIDSGT
ncbi:MAG: TetR/AcrR family transcriptional regulator [Planctomycetota bacterium]